MARRFSHTILVLAVYWYDGFLMVLAIPPPVPLTFNKVFGSEICEYAPLPPLV
jgi:hypothetical protein